MKMRLVCDADGLIKMNKAGILEMVARHAEVLLGPEIFREAVEEGKARGYPDAFEIELVSKQFTLKRPHVHPQADRILRERELGSGEREALQLYLSEEAEAIVSDDQAFLSLLEAHSVPYLTPAAIVVLLAERGILRPLEKAYEALERLRPLIRQEQYRAAYGDLREIKRST